MTQIKQFLPLIVVIISLSTIFILKPELFSASHANLTQVQIERYAEKVLDICKDRKYRPVCYDEEIPKLMDEISMEEAFEVTRLVQDGDPSYTYCHVLGHELSAREVQKDPSNWKDVITRVPSGLCSNGGIHGAFQERFRAEFFVESQKEEMKKELAVVCEKRGTWNPTRMEQASCYHALGHLTMYLTQADIFESLDICDEISKKEDGRDYKRVCYDGAFMQIFQPLEPEDFAMIEGKEVARDELEGYCAQFSQARKGSCWSEGWALFREDIKKPEGLVLFCSKAQASEQGRCHDGLVYVITSQSGLDSEKMKTYCSGMPAEWIGRCLGNAASRMLETDYRNISKAVNFCKDTESFDVDNYCYKELLKYSTFNFHAGSAEFLDLCNQMPENWRYTCLKAS